MTAKNKHNHTAPVAPAPAAPAAASDLERLKTEAAENWDKFLRATADLENYRKRAAREREEIARHTREHLIAALLPVLDNLERAIAASAPPGGEPSSLREGLQQVEAQFKRVLQEFGVEEIIARTGHPFDPNLHEAISQLESAEHAEGIVLDQVQRGYKLTERLLRPARVIVSKGPATPPEPDAESS